MTGVLGSFSVTVCVCVCVCVCVTVCVSLHGGAFTKTKK